MLFCIAYPRPFAAAAARGTPRARARPSARCAAGPSESKQRECAETFDANELELVESSSAASGSQPMCASCAARAARAESRRRRRRRRGAAAAADRADVFRISNFFGYQNDASRFYDDDFSNLLD